MNTETPITFPNGTRAQYCIDTETGKHAYLNLDTDMFMSDREVFAAMEMRSACTVIRGE